MNNKTTYYIRILVAAYLLYLSYQLMGGIISGETPNKLFILAPVLFVACSAFFIFTSVKALNRIAKEEKEAAEAELEEETEEIQEEPSKPMSISERARLAGELDSEEVSEDNDREQQESSEE